MASLDELTELCKLVRYNILTSTTEAGSGHATSALSAVELLTSLFFGGYFRQDLDDPKSIKNDRFILSKGHASPLLYALYQAAGAISYDELLTLRKFGSSLEGHPTPNFKYADIATGSLGQGLSVGLGMALGIRYQMSVIGNQKSDTENRQLNTENLPKVFVLIGDSEFSEGQNYEALQLASYYKVDNLIGILDVNRLGQRGETMLGWDMETYARRIESFGWQVEIIKDGHNIEKILETYQNLFENPKFETLNSKPKFIVAKTVKGRGVSFLEDKNGWHGKSLTKEQLKSALEELGEVDLDLKGKIINRADANFVRLGNNSIPTEQQNLASSDKAEYSTREAYGDALVLVGQTDPNLVVLDAEVSNSTYAEKFKKAFPDRYFEMFIAEQNMASVGLGMSKVGLKPYVSTFAAFLTRAFDQIRMSRYSNANIVFCGSHAGVSIGQDGPSQMGLEDIAMFQSIPNSVVLHPADAVSMAKLIDKSKSMKGIVYVRSMRPKTQVIYDGAEEFEVGGSKILKESASDKAVVFAAGITVHEALKAHEELKKESIEIAVIDLYSIKPVDEKTIKRLVEKTPNVIVVEDHYPYGGLGETVSVTVPNFIHLCIKEIPRSGTPAELMSHYGIDSKAIINAVRTLQK